MLLGVLVAFVPNILVRTLGALLDRQILDAFQGEPMDKEHPKYLCAPCSNCKGQIRDIINEEMEAIWSGEKSAQKAMDDAKTRGDSLLRKFEKTN